MGFKGRALASVKVTSEESPVPRQGTVGRGLARRIIPEKRRGGTAERDRMKGGEGREGGVDGERRSSSGGERTGSSFLICPKVSGSLVTPGGEPIGQS